MLKFSAVRGRQGGSKTYYKGYEREECAMEDMKFYLRNYSVSSYMYKDGATAGGEQCEGHRAGEDVIEAGNVLFFDFDSKYIPVTLHELAQKFSGVSAYIAPSSGWSPEREKYHVAVEMAEDLPLGKDEFKHLYKAAAQKLGIEGLYDPAMEVWVQQLAPHFRSDAPELWIDGEPLGDCLADYVPLEGVKEVSGIQGEVPEGTVFTLSTSRQLMGVDAIAEHVKARGKTRVHCIMGHEHDGRRDTAFVNVSESGSLFYYCSGGRCGHTLRIAENPFEADDEEQEEETRQRTVRDVIEESGVHAAAYGEKAAVGTKEAAVNYAMGESAANLYRIGNEIRRYNGVYWEAIFKDEAVIRNRIKQLIVSAGFEKEAFSNSFTEATFKYFVKHVNSREIEIKGNFLNLQNCVLEIASTGIKQHPHEEGYLFTSVLPYDYDPAARAPVWEMVVDRVMCGDADTAQSFQQAMGYLLLRDYNLEKMISLVGGGENGKSTVLRVLRWLIGSEAQSSIPIQQLLKDNGDGAYSRAELVGKLVNVTNELDTNALKADAFKDLISGEGIQARPIYGKPFTLETVPKQVVAMNDTNHLVKERTHGFMRRLLFIPFNYTLKEEHKDPELDKKLQGELAGILNWFLDGARQVLAQGKIKESLASRRLFEDVKRDSNPMQQFVEEHLEVFDGFVDLGCTHQVIKSSEIMEHYREFCVQNGYKPLGRNKALNELERLGVPRVDVSLYPVDAPRVHLKGFHADYHESGLTSKKHFDVLYP